MPILLIIFFLLFPYDFAFSGVDHLAADYRPLRGKNIDDCASKLKSRSGGWCEIRHSDLYPSISSVWPKNIDNKTRMITGPSSILHAWNSAAFDASRYKLFFMSGGHADYGGNEVYEFDLKNGSWSRITEPSPLDYLFISRDYDADKKKPWRRLCWIPNINTVPASTHTYDGLIFSDITQTIFLYVMGAANGSCIEDQSDKFKSDPLVLGTTADTIGWYEFNPSNKITQNNLPPLSWRKVLTFEQLKSKAIHQGYPVSTLLNNGSIVFGSRYKTVKYNPENISQRSFSPFSAQADWGDGTKIYDSYRNIVWSLHNKALLAFDGDRGSFLYKLSADSPHGKSLAVAKDKRLYAWDGTSSISVIDPDGDRQWKTLEWSINGPPTGDGRVYGKWVYLDKEDLFVGLSTHKTGVWVYKHPENPTYTQYSNINPQDLVNKSKPGDKVTIPPGTYRHGIFVNKSLHLGLNGVIFRGTVNKKSIINISCDNCNVLIDDFVGDGAVANCQWGNCAGIKAEGNNFNLTLKNARISKTVMGVLTDNRGGQVILEDSIIEDTGIGGGSSTLGHGFYAGDIDKVIVKNSIVRRSFGKGHIFKSRASDTLIENSVLAGLDGRHSRIIDFPCGGKLTIRNSVLQQGKQTDNIDLISVGTEPQNCGGGVHSSDISIKNSWLIFDREESADEPSADYGFNRIFTWRAPVSHFDVSQNRIIESTGRMRFDGEDHIPDMSRQNQMFQSRKDAGLGPVEIPYKGIIQKPLL
ncbi:hypothetical protein [Sedimenticola selenatireducens]|uniref:Right handed beta helix domain-containing protein n=1 Tax=Sedimenticola selenatireducens TaxID=191960 RepID=A0A557S837_9GAMM|nr:hypothetical protein [Sedimenticola selenatireducens]TVO73589.1 hypothetical protein FHP88_12025 [Sedimenticola selenatireducens]TVT63529.1 MAG: hypothetical protein FHK78_11955 [Sedimenticola selenatireducens]